MREQRAVLLAALLVSAAAQCAATVITVDDDGGADFLTIQEAVDVAAPMGDTVLVYPGTYTDLHETWGWGDANVNCYKVLTLRSVGGPEVTVLDGGGLASHGVYAEVWPVIVEGFTVRSGGPSGIGYSAITIISGEVRGNVCSGYQAGVAGVWYYARGDEPRLARDDLLVIEGNTFEDSFIGVHASDTFTGAYAISDNSFSSNEVGVFVELDQGEVALVGNEISSNGTGVRIRCGSLADHPLVVTLEGNRIVGNADANLDVWAHDNDPEHVFDLTIGGSLGGANDVHSSPVNLSADTWGGLQFTIDATYNFWGSVACSTFVPLFDIDVNLPDSAFVFEPFVDELHAVVYENCEGVAVENGSWGSIKALFR